MEYIRDSIEAFLAIGHIAEIYKVQENIHIALKDRVARSKHLSKTGGNGGK